MDINKAWIIFPLFFIILSATTMYSATFLKPGSAYFGDTEHPELDYSEIYENTTLVNITVANINEVNTDVNKISFLGIELPDVFSPARDLYTMLRAGLNVPIVIGETMGLETSFIITIIGFMSVLTIIGFLFFMRGTV